ncbi:MAG: glucose-1-phosphate cytidylyltransferase [Actinobacteria bacterium]|nr:glucose-1-phosphate cytidylyltransferase [Actinomycetota bacterium]
MKTVILAGGLGTRLSEETGHVPKPMVEVAGQPILWHIMRHYAHHGFKEFIVALGYKGWFIKRFLLDVTAMHNSLTVNVGSGEVELHHDSEGFDWSVHLLETGLHTLTGGRVKQALPLIGDETFMMTYGDGVSDVDLQALVDFHRSHGKLATMTVVRPPSHFGRMDFDGDQVVEFVEKPRHLDDWINGGFFVLEPGVGDYLDKDGMWERIGLERLAADGQLMAYRHESFWHCMDSLRDKRILEQLWEEGKAPWRSWT